MVDDHYELVLAHKYMLQKEGYEVATADNGETGLKVARDILPDIILLDVNMPGMSGIEVCRELTNDELTKDIPVILVTAQSEPEITKMGFEAGAFDYIKKPINRVDLKARIESALRFYKRQQMEKLKTLTATMVSANHEIRQPLTILNLSITAIKREMAKPDINRDAVLAKINYIEEAISKIDNILDNLKSVKKVNFSKYLKDIFMIDLEQAQEEDPGGEKTSQE